LSTELTHTTQNEKKKQNTHVVFEDVTGNSYDLFICLLFLSVGLCDPGFFCPGGDVVANPAVSECWPGYYCPQGSPTPTRCPIGTFSNSSGNINETDCMSCTPGNDEVFFSDVQGLRLLGISFLAEWW
jgi:hypothetical protein